MNVQELYQQKLCTAESAVKLVKSGDWVDYSQTCSFPEALDAALAARRNELTDVKIRSAISMKPVQVVEQDPEHKAFTFNVWHCSGRIESMWTRVWPTILPCCSAITAHIIPRVLPL